MVVIKKNNKIFLIMSILFIGLFTFTFCGKANKDSNVKEVDIYDVVKEAYLTDKGYSKELSKHMSKDVFERTNIYNTYNVDDPKYKKPFKVAFYLNEDSQSKEKDIVYVKMIYTVEIKDSQNKVVGGSGNVPITFTVEKSNDNWYINDKSEPA